MVIGPQIGGGWPTAGITVRADWTSDNGPDYGWGLGDNGAGGLGYGGDGSFSSTTSQAYSESAYTMQWQLFSKGGGAGDTYSGGEVVNNFGGALNNDAFSVYHLCSRLGTNEPGWGISTSGQMNTYFGISPDVPFQPIYWAMDWTLSIHGEGAVYAYANVDGVNWRDGNTYGPPRNIFSGGAGGDIYITGSETGMEQWYPYGGHASYPPFALSAGIWDNTGEPRQGSLDLWARIRFSTTPIDAVPEPSAWALLAGGLLAWGWGRGNRRKVW